MSKSASNLTAYKMISAQNFDYNTIKNFNMEAMKPSDLSSAFIAIFIFGLLWIIMQINYVFFLSNFEINGLIIALFYNTTKLFAGIVVVLCIGLYLIIYKFVLNGKRDAAAIGVTAKFSAIAIGLATIIANARTTQYLDLVGMFENTLGIWYICLTHPQQLKSILRFESGMDDAISVSTTDDDEANEIVSETDVKLTGGGVNRTISEHAHAELASIFLSRVGIPDLVKYQFSSPIISLDDTLQCIFSKEDLRRMVILKNVVAQFCWLFFAVIAATFASIPELISIA